MADERPTQDKLITLLGNLNQNVNKSINKTQTWLETKASGRPNDPSPAGFEQQPPAQIAESDINPQTPDPLTTISEDEKKRTTDYLSENHFSRWLDRAADDLLDKDIPLEPGEFLQMLLDAEAQDETAANGSSGKARTLIMPCSSCQKAKLAFLDPCPACGKIRELESEGEASGVDVKPLLSMFDLTKELAPTENVLKSETRQVMETLEKEGAFPDNEIVSEETETTGGIWVLVFVIIFISLSISLAIIVDFYEI